MNNISRAFDKIIKELIYLCENPMSIHTDEPHSIPGSIDTRVGGPIVVSRKIESEISKIAAWMFQHRPEARAQYTYKDWRATVRGAFGPALYAILSNDDLNENWKLLKILVEQEIDDHISSQGIRFESMGCTLFSRPLEFTYTIGPVTFEPKMTWLDRMFDAELVGKVIHRRISKVFLGQNIKQRRNSFDAGTEKFIIEAFENSPMVCTVKTDRLALELARKRSIIAARLAQVSIALALHPLPSRVLEGFNLDVDHGPRIATTISLTPGGRSIGYSSQMIGKPHGPNLDVNVWSDIAHNQRNFFNVAGTMINCWTSSAEYNSASSLIRCLSQALYFFSDACRDENELMSIVKFAAALEALVPGKSKQGVLELAKARIGINDVDEYAENKTLKQVVELIYKKGRSRTLHGTNAQIAHDWSKTRLIAEHLAGNCIVSSMKLVEQNSHEEDPEILLK